MLLALLYIWLAEPTAFQKEASARSLISHLATEDVRPEYLYLADSATCALTPGQSASPGMHGQLVVAVECSVDTPCGEVVSRPVWHAPFFGAYVSGDPFMMTIGLACPKMLTDASQQRFQAQWEKGG